MTERGEVQRVPIDDPTADTLSQWAFELVPVDDPIGARLTTAVLAKSRRLATTDYTAVIVGLVDELPDDEARELLDVLVLRVGARQASPSPPW